MNVIEELKRMAAADSIWQVGVWGTGSVTNDNYEFHERVAILMEACGYTEAQAIEAAQRQARVVGQFEIPWG